jgi:uncharacterized protein (DUF2141 family)
MAGRYLLLIVALLAASCAEVVPLTGGPEDETAPRIVTQEPEQGATNFNGNAVSVEFDEYVKLNDPKNTISINPATVKLEPELDRRTMNISWDGSLDPNTTYIIQLNGAIRDNNESNDSIMQLVFSTGPVIDSLELSGTVAGALSNAAEPQMTVALFHPDSNVLRAQPIYATRTDTKGKFTFSYLRPGSYRIFGFSDANKDRRVQPDETIAFGSENVQAGDSNEIILRSFPRAAKKNALRADIVAPGALKAYNLDSLNPQKLKINNEPAKLLEAYSPDSMLFALPVSMGTNYIITYDSTRFSKSLTAAERSAAFPVMKQGKSDKWIRGDTLYFRVNSLVTGIDTTKISIEEQKTGAAGFRAERFGNNGILIVPAVSVANPFTVKLEKGAISGPGSVSDSASFSYGTLLATDLSNLTINCKGFEGQWIMELTLNDKVLYSKIKPSGDTAVVFSGIVPGTYALRCTEDRNANGKWDPGDLGLMLQPEIVKRFTLRQKLRPNWDIEETITEE